jgi:hypothetical protein
VTISDLGSEMYTRRFYKCIDVINWETKGGLYSLFLQYPVVTIHPINSIYILRCATDCTDSKDSKDSNPFDFVAFRETVCRKAISICDNWWNLWQKKDFWGWIVTSWLIILETW